MRKLSHRELRAALRGAAPSPPLPPAAPFWARFTSRTAIHPQLADAPASQAPAWWPRLALGAVTAVAVLLLVVTLHGPQGGGLPEPVKLSEVRGVDVFVDYATVMIVEDNEHQGTVLWLAGLDG